MIEFAHPTSRDLTLKRVAAQLPVGDDDAAAFLLQTDDAANRLVLDPFELDRLEVTRVTLGPRVEGRPRAQ